MIGAREWVFQFDLPAVARAWPYRGAALVVRNYHCLAGGSTVSDFLGLVAPGMAVGEDPRLNVAAEPVRLSDHDAAALMVRFGPGNRRLCRAMGIAADGLVEPPRWAPDAIEVT